MEKVYIFEQWGGIYCTITRDELRQLQVYVVNEVPTLAELITKMISDNHMSALYGNHLLRSGRKYDRVCWINLNELYDDEDEYFDTVYEMTFVF